VIANLGEIQKKKYAPDVVKVAKQRQRRGGRRDNRPVGAGQYRLQPGDTLWDIAKKNGLSVPQLKKLNDIDSPRRLRAGDVIKVR
jgi:nucleoid-associated protein YgaU